MTKAPILFTYDIVGEQVIISQSDWNSVLKFLEGTVDIELQPRVFEQTNGAESGGAQVDMQEVERTTESENGK